MSTPANNERKRAAADEQPEEQSKKPKRVVQVKLNENNLRQMWIARDSICALLRTHPIDAVERVLQGRLVALKHKMASDGLPQTDLYEIVHLVPGAYHAYPVGTITNGLEQHTVGLDLKLHNGEILRRSLANVRDGVVTEYEMMQRYLAAHPKMARDELKRRTAPIALHEVGK